MQRNPIAEYTQRFNKVLDFIDRQLAEPIDLAALADVAHFSPFHFHRLFSAWMGETLGDYLRRRRLEVGALQLLHRPRKPVLDIALEIGFGSGEAFARAFKLQFGVTPSVWRRTAMSGCRAGAGSTAQSGSGIEQDRSGGPSVAGG